MAKEPGVMFDQKSAGMIADTVRQVRGGRPIRAYRRGHHFRGGRGGLDWSDFPLGFTIASGNMVTIAQGRFDALIPPGTSQPGGRDIVGTVTFQLTGQPAWVFVRRVKRGAEYPYVNNGAWDTEPFSTADEYRIPIWKFETTDGGVNYSMTYPALFDIRLGVGAR